jgi:hypothetical protein
MPSFNTKVNSVLQFNKSTTGAYIPQSWPAKHTQTNKQTKLKEIMHTVAVMNRLMQYFQQI